MSSGKRKFLRELPDARVPLVDQLPAMLGDLAFGEITSPRPTTAAEPRVGFVNRGVDAGLLEAIGTRESGESCADDDDTTDWHRPASHANSGGARAVPAMAVKTVPRNSRREEARSWRTCWVSTLRLAASAATEMA